MGPRILQLGRLAVVLVVGCLMLSSLPAPSRAASPTWKVSLSPTSVHAGTATIEMTFSNLGGPDGHTKLGCVRLQLQLLAFTVLVPTVTDEPPGTTWVAARLTTISVHAQHGGDRLEPDDPSASVTAAIPVLALFGGQYTWTATAYESQTCTKPFEEVIDLPIEVVGPGATPQPTPTPTTTPTPTPTATPTPTPTPTGVPTPSPKPTPTPTPTPRPTASPASATPSPSPTKAVAPSDPPSNGPRATTRPATPKASGSRSASAEPSPSPVTPDEPGAALLMAGFDDGPGDGGPPGGPPIDGSIHLASGFDTSFGPGFTWAVPGLVLGVPGLLVVLAVILAQALSAFAWLPLVRRRIGAFDITRRS